MKESAIRVVIIDGENDARDAVTSILSGHEDFSILAYGKDAYDALNLASRLKPDIAILGSRLGYIDREEIPPLLRARSPSTAVVILTAKASDLQLCRAVFNEVSGLVQRETDIHFLPWILKCVSSGGCFLSPPLAARVLHLLSGAANKRAKEEAAPRDDPAKRLSKTEMRILIGVGEGSTSGEIAKNLDLAVGTVRNYISSVMHKMGLDSRVQMARYAFKCGLVPSFAKPGHHRARP
ncbi:MAG: response regulator transcription factor [Treponema sp.]|nr:response regulator transcription factor [Treponema sp.]